MKDKVEDRVAWGTALALAVAGSVLIAMYPLARTLTRREHDDISRATEFLLRVRLADLRTSDRTFEVEIPDDAQWRRIEKRVGPPAFILAVGGDPIRRSQLYRASDVGLRASARRNGTDVPLKPARAVPAAYNAPYPDVDNGFEMAAMRGDRLTVNLRIEATNVPVDAVAVLAPNWSAPDLGSWGEAAAAGDIVWVVGGIVAAIAGAMLILWALTLALGRSRLF
jgi:hypothetical protein